MSSVAPINQPTLESLIKGFKCGGLGLADAVNLIGRIISNSFSVSDDKIVLTIEGSSFVLPRYDGVAFEYAENGVADDDLMTSQLFYKDEVLVAVLTYNYIGTTNNINSIVLTIP
jgi:ABC-type phosphate transport system substrate-binding protein